MKLAILAAAVAGFATTSARASIETFEWVPDTTDFGKNSATAGTSGSLQYNTDTGAITDFVFYDASSSGKAYSKPDGTYTSEPAIYNNNAPSDYLLSNGDLELGGAGSTSHAYGYSSGGSEFGTAPNQTTWTISGTTPAVGTADESEAYYAVDKAGDSVNVYGDWVLYSPVPEPTIYGVLAGAGLLLVSLRRQLGRKTA